MSCISWFKALLFITRVPGDIWSRGKKKRLSHCEEVKALELFTVSQNKKSVAESQSRSEFDGLCHMTVQVAAIFALMLLYMHNWTFVCAFCLKASVSQRGQTRELQDKRRDKRGRGRSSLFKSKFLVYLFD